MRKLSFVLLMTLLCLLFLPAAGAAAATPSFDLYFEFDKDQYEVGDTVKAQLILERNDGSSDSYSMFVFESSVIFSSVYLEYIDSSENANNAKDVVVTEEAYTYNQDHRRIGVSYMGLIKKETRAARLVVAELEFKALANVAPGYLYHPNDPQVGLSDKELCAVNAIRGEYQIGDAAAPTYTVGFASGGGSGSAPAAIPNHAAGDIFVLPAISYTRSGYTAVGWADGSQTHSPGTAYTMPARNVTFTAQWTADPSYHSIRFQSGGGIGTTPQLEDHVTGSTIVLPNCPYVKDGYTFVGWSDGSATYATDYIYTMPDADLTFTAVWTVTPSGGNPGENVTVITYEPGSTTGTVVSGSAAVVVATPGSGVNPQPTNNSAMPFLDVHSGDWFYQDVLTAYQQGLIDGMTATTFVPTGNLTLAQAIKLAACMHQYYHTGAVTLTNSSPNWYSGYVAYAIENHIISEGQFSDYTATATRAQFAVIFSAALPFSCYQQINTIKAGVIPDVRISAYGGTAIYKLYRAGIVQGSDSAHNFLPNTNISRSEVAAILTRMMNAETRKAFTL